MSNKVTLKVKKGSIFFGKETIKVNPVNCRGVMGAGLAKQFKDNYPVMFKHYQQYCCEMRLCPGGIYVWRVPDYSGDLIVNLATKDHWKDSSSYGVIHQGMTNLFEWYQKLLAAYPGAYRSMAIPEVGAGLGGLAGEKVQKIVSMNLDFHFNYKPLTYSAPEEYKPVEVVYYRYNP